jgi:hypothetical protein
VKLESHATPQLETPQQRYARLHRAIECGLASDEIWKDLADVCLRLGHGDEAVRCMRRIQGTTMRIALASRLARLGLIAPPPDQNVHRHAAAPAASHAGTAAAPTVAVAVATEPEEHVEHRLADHVVDAFQFLFHQQMPWLVLITTLAFPLVVGVGGFLNAGGSWLLLAAIAALPGLVVLAIVGAMGREVLLTSAEGHDIQGLPGFQQLVLDARRFLTDVGLVFGTLIGPSLLAMACGLPLLSALPGLAIGAFFAPMAWTLRLLRGDYAALSPVVLMRGISRTIRSYAGLSAVAVGLFLPAAAVAWVVFGRPVWVQIAVIGPLSVLPVFVASRLLGTWVDSQRHRLGTLLHAEVQPAAKPKTAAQPAKPAVAAATTKVAAKVAPKAVAPAAAAVRPAATSQRPTRRPAAARPSPAAPAARSMTGATAAQPPRPQPPARPTPAAGKPIAKAAAQPSAKPAPAAAPAPAKPAPRAIEGRGPAARRTSDAPVLAQMPGAVVVKGSERKRQGAAAKRP